MPDILIKNTKVFFNNYLQPAEVTIEDGKITKIAKDIHVSSVDHVIDAGGALTLPAGIDVHVHFRDPGLTGTQVPVLQLPGDQNVTIST
jgi:dihydroorotase